MTPDQQAAQRERQLMEYLRMEVKQEVKNKTFRQKLSGLIKAR